MSRPDLSEWPPKPDTPQGIEAVPRGRRGARRWDYRTRWTDPISGRRLEGGPFRDLAAAEAHYARLQLARARDDVAELAAGDRTLHEFTRLEWWPNYAGRRLERNTLRSYASTYNLHIRPLVGHLPLRRLTPPRVRDLRDELERAGVGAPTVRRALSVLQGICRYAVEAGAMTINPAREIEKPAQRRRLAIVAPSANDVELVRAQLEHARDIALLAVLAYQGPRPFETLALEVRHVGDVTLLVEQRIIDGRIVPGQKNARRLPDAHRTPKLRAPVREDLDAYLTERGRARRRDLLFPNKHGGPWTARDWRAWTETVLMPAADRAGVELGRVYDLRHGAANIMLRAGLPLADVAAELGNSVATVSRYYTHIVAEMAGKPTVPIEQQIAKARARAHRRHRP